MFGEIIRTRDRYCVCRAGKVSRGRLAGKVCNEKASRETFVLMILFRVACGAAIFFYVENNNSNIKKKKKKHKITEENIMVKSMRLKPGRSG